MNAPEESLAAAVSTPATDLTLRSDIRVRADTPPTFLVHAQDDPIDPVKHSLTYYAAPVGRWPVLVEEWLQTIGVLGAPGG